MPSRMFSYFGRAGVKFMPAMTRSNSVSCDQPFASHSSTALLTATPTAIQCHSLYCLSANGHQDGGLCLFERDVPHYFAALRARRQIVQSAWLPQVVGQAAYEWNDGSRGSPASAWVAGATVRMSLFTGGARLARVREAAHGIERAAAERDRLEAAVRLEVLTALEQLSAAHARRAVAADVFAHRVRPADGGA